MNKPIVTLLGKDGNSFSIMGRCKTSALEAGWSQTEWTRVMEEMMSRDYDHLLQTVGEYFEVR